MTPLELVLRNLLLDKEAVVCAMQQDTVVYGGWQFDYAKQIESINLDIEHHMSSKPFIAAVQRGAFQSDGDCYDVERADTKNI
jgi:DICT domain-containing protein